MAVSSSNSRTAVARESSPSSTRPFGTVQAPKSRPLQNGPPGWTRKTSSPFPERRNRSSPALTFLRFNAHEWSVHGEPQYPELRRLCVGCHVPADFRPPTCCRARSLPERPCPQLSRVARVQVRSFFRLCGCLFAQTKAQAPRQLCGDWFALQLPCSTVVPSCCGGGRAAVELRSGTFPAVMDNRPYGSKLSNLVQV
jgi:hypothetical protein